MYSLEENSPRCRIFWLDGAKFKTNLWTIFFDLPLKKETATKTALLAEVLKAGCKPYPNVQALAKAAEEMYGAVWDVSVVKKGDRQLLLFSLETAKAVDADESIRFLRAVLTEPLLENEGFREDIVAHCRETVRRSIAAGKDDPREYAKKRCLEEATKGTPTAVAAEGYAEDLDALDGKTLYAYYKKIMETAAVKIIYCTEEQDKMKPVVFRRIFRGGAPLERICEEQPIRKPVFVKEEGEVEQARLMLAFDTRGSNRSTRLVLNEIFGGGADSLLFQNIREKAGLCYDIKSYLYPLTGLLFVQTGVDVQHAKQAAVGILKALEELRESPVAPKRLEQAKTAVLQRYRMIGDQPWSMVDYAANCILQEKPSGLAHTLRRIGRVTSEDVCHMAGRTKLCAVYLLKGREAQQVEAK